MKAKMDELEDHEYDTGKVFRAGVRLLAVILGIIALAVFLFARTVCAQEVGAIQIGVMQFDTDFSNSYLTDTLVVVGNHMQFNIPALDYLEFQNPTIATVEYHWSGVMWIVAEDLPVRDGAVLLRTYPGYNYSVYVNLWNDQVTAPMRSREYFVIALRSIPEIKHSVFSRSILQTLLGTNWPQKMYDARFDFNNDSRIDRLDWLIFERTKYW